MKRHIIVFFFVILLFLSACTEQKFSKLPKDYKDLRDRCDYIVSLAPNGGSDVQKAEDCCLRSIIKMAEEGYKPANITESSGNVHKKCPGGFKKNSLACDGSYTWCEPLPGEQKSKDQGNSAKENTNSKNKQAEEKSTKKTNSGKSKPDSAGLSGSEGITRLTNNDVVEKKPKISGDKIVYYTDDRSQVRLYSVDTDTKNTKQLTTAKSGFTFDYDFDAENIVWEQTNSIYTYNIQTGQKDEVNKKDSKKVSIEIKGDSIVWHDDRNIDESTYSPLDYKNNYDIYLYNIDKGREEQITEDAYKQVIPDISKDYIVWEDTRNKDAQTSTIGSNIFLYDRTTKQVQQITSSLSSMYPVIAGDYIFYGDFRNNAQPTERDAYYKYDIFVYDINSGQETRLYKNDKKLDNEVYIDASQDYAAWKIKDSNEAKIVYYNIAEEEIKELSEDIIDFSIDGSKLVFTKKINGKTEIFYKKLGGKNYE